MSESVRLAVCIGQPAVMWKVAAKVDRVFDPELPNALLKRRSEVSLATDDEPPAGIDPTKAADHVGERQGILLGLEPADAEGDELAGVVAGTRGLQRRGHLPG